MDVKKMSQTNNQSTRKFQRDTPRTFFVFRFAESRKAYRYLPILLWHVWFEKVPQATPDDDDSQSPIAQSNNNHDDAVSPKSSSKVDN
jgi:hypothetical protein